MTSSYWGSPPALIERRGSDAVSSPGSGDPPREYCRQRRPPRGEFKGVMAIDDLGDPEWNARDLCVIWGNDFVCLGAWRVAEEGIIGYL